MYQHQSHAVIKLQSGKPSRIAIRFAYKYKALQAYELLMTSYRGHPFGMTLEPKPKHLNLWLQSLQNGERILYKELCYKPDDMRQLLATGRQALPFEFVHIYSEANKLLIAKPFGKSDFLTISSYEILGVDPDR